MIFEVKHCWLQLVHRWKTVEVLSSANSKCRLHLIRCPRTELAMGQFWRFQILSFSGFEKFWRFQILTFSGFERFWHFQILTFSGSEGFWHFQILTSSDSDKFRFWYFPILTFSDSDIFRIWPKMDSDVFKFWHVHVSPVDLPMWSLMGQQDWKKDKS